MKKGYTDIILVLDRSGSMQGREADVIGGVNKLIQDQKLVPGEATLSLIQFDDHYEPEYLHRDLRLVLPLQVGQYRPRGSTALLDAIGRTITEAGRYFAGMSEDARPEKVVMMIFTDGYENASKEYSLSHVKTLIAEHKGVWKWDIVFIGGDLDAVAEGAKLGLSQAGTLSYNNTAVGTSAAYRATSHKLAQVRSGAVLDMSFTPEEQEQVKSEK